MELIDIVDEKNELTGEVAERWEAYEKGLWKRTVSCWIMNENGEVLLQKRSANKKINASKWSKTGGQVDSGETVEEAILREVKEELGVDIPKEQTKVVDIYKDSYKHKKFSYNFIFVVNYKINDYILQKEEVEKVKYVTIEEMELARKNNDSDYTFCNWEDNDFYKEMELLKNKRSLIMYNRISIVGGSGSGKSTLCNILSKELNLPSIHLDAINFNSNWVEIDKEERDKIILKKTLEDKWIIDGNYNKTLKERFNKADLIIWLDYSTFMQLKGVLKRFLKTRNKERNEIPGCKERFNLDFIKYVITYNKKKRPIIVEYLKDIEKDKVLIFRKQKELNKWLRDFIKIQSKAS